MEPIIIWVNMNDKFMSGWGLAKNGRSILSVRCHSIRQAEAIFAAAKERKEMRRIAMSDRRREGGKGDHVSIRDFDEMGGPWRAHYKPSEEAPQ